MGGVEFAKHDLLLVSIVLVVGLLSAAIAKKIKVPDIVIFLIAGVLLGPQISGIVHVEADSTFNQIILLFGAGYLLFDGGASLRFAVLKNVWITIVVISTVGVLITGAIVAGTAALFGIPILTALLLGATIASTDPATLVPIFKQVPIKDRVAQTVMSESALNDAMGAIATFTMIAIVTGTGQFSVGSSLLDLAWKAGIGIVVGGVVGFVAGFLTGHAKFGFLRELKTLVTIIGIIGCYMIAEGVGASGFMAIFVFGVMIGNKESFGFKLSEQAQEHYESFVGTTSLIMRLMIFVLLGTQVNFALLQQYWLVGLGVVLVFMFIARPLTVFICAGIDRRAKWSLKELLFMSWTRETGVIPAALVGMMIGMNVPGAEVVSSITFMAILVTIIVQAPTTAPLAGKLGLLIKDEKQK